MIMLTMTQANLTLSIGGTILVAATSLTECVLILTIYKRYLLVQNSIWRTYAFGLVQDMLTLFHKHEKFERRAKKCVLIKYP